MIIEAIYFNELWSVFFILKDGEGFFFFFFFLACSLFFSILILKKSQFWADILYCLQRFVTACLQEITVRSRLPVELLWQCLPPSFQPKQILAIQNVQS